MRCGDEGRRSAGVGAGFEDRRSSSDVDGIRGRNEPMGVGGRGNGERARSAPSCSPWDGAGGGGGLDSPGLMTLARLYSRQQDGHRHSTTSAPSGLL